MLSTQNIRVMTAMYFLLNRAVGYITPKDLLTGRQHHTA